MSQRTQKILMAMALADYDHRLMQRTDHPIEFYFQRGTSRLLKEARGASTEGGGIWTNQSENTEHTKPERTTEKRTPLIEQSARKRDRTSPSQSTRASTARPGHVCLPRE